MLRNYEVIIDWDKPIERSYRSFVKYLTKDEALEIAHIYNQKRKQCKAVIKKLRKQA